MGDSILTSIKQMLGIEEEQVNFDVDIVIHINSVFSILAQLGVGPSGGFSIRDKTTLWSEFIGDSTILELVKSYMYMKVKLIFDPPLSSAVIEAMKVSIAEFEWRLNTLAESQTQTNGGIHE